MQINVWFNGIEPTDVIYANSRTGTIKRMNNGVLEVLRGVVDVRIHNPQALILDGVEVKEVVETVV